MVIAKVGLVPVFDLQVNGVGLLGFTKESNWEGLYKLRNEDGEFVIVAGDPENKTDVEVLRMTSGLKKKTQLPERSSKQGDFFGPFQPTHTHTANCNDYQLLYVSNVKATRKKGWDRQAVYTDGETIWSRPWEDFEGAYSPK